jgi:hypothetical protein
MRTKTTPIEISSFTLLVLFLAKEPFRLRPANHPHRQQGSIPSLKRACYRTPITLLSLSSRHQRVFQELVLSNTAGPFEVGPWSSPHRVSSLSTGPRQLCSYSRDREPFRKPVALRTAASHDNYVNLSVSCLT